MRRGLKAARSASLMKLTFGSTMFPDEEGTESHMQQQQFQPLYGSTMFPDEEGTERSAIRCWGSCCSIVRRCSPMRRGLKEDVQLPTRYESAPVRRCSPMRRGLKDHV